MRTFNTGGGPSVLLNPAATTVTIGFGYYFAGAKTLSSSILNLYDGANQRVNLVFVANGAPHNMRVRNGTTIIADSTQANNINTWDYYEIKVVCHATAGSIEFRRNGVVDPQLTVSNVNTGAQCTRVALGSLYTQTSYYDDWYINDGDGIEHNSFEGAITVLPALPIGQGSYAAFTPSAGADHVAMVNQATPDGDTTYCVGDAAGSRESYLYAPVAAQSVRAVQITHIVRKEDAGTRTARAIIRRGAAETPGPTEALSATYSVIRAIAEVDPSTGNPWTNSALSEIEGIIEIVS